MNVDPHARKLLELAAQFGITTTKAIHRNEAGNIDRIDERAVDPSALIREGIAIVKAWPISADVETLVQRFDASAAFAAAWATSVQKDQPEAAAHLQLASKAFDQIRDVILDGGIAPTQYQRWIN